MLAPFGFDQYLLPAFAHQLPGYEWFFYAVTQIGSSFTITVLASLALLLGKGKLKVFAAVLLIGMLFSTVIVADLKDIFERPRPPGAGISGFMATDSYAFPSGHATTIFLTATVLGAYYGWRYYVSGYVLAIAVGLSRLYLGVHYPSDVLAGAALGIALGGLLVYAAYRYGLCDGPGPCWFLPRPAKRGEKAIITGPGLALSALVSLAVTASALACYLNFPSLSIAALAIPSLLVILYAAARRDGYGRGITAAFVILTIGIISAMALLFLGSYPISLAIIAIVYVASIINAAASDENKFL